MCGISGSGKSTKTKELAKEYNAMIVSTDEIRKIKFNDVNNQKHNREVFKYVFWLMNIYIKTFL